MKSLKNILKSRDITLLTKVHIVKAVVFPVVMYGWESWIIKKAECWRIGASKLWCWNLLDSKEIKPLNPKGNQSWIFTGRTDAGAEAPSLWPPDGKSRPTGKDSDAGKDRGQEEKGTTEDEMEGITNLMDMSLRKLQELVKLLVCHGPWGRKELDMT